MKMRCRGRYMFDFAQFSALAGRCAMQAALIKSSLRQSWRFGYLLHFAQGTGNKGSVLWGRWGWGTEVCETNAQDQTILSCPRAVLKIHTLFLPWFSFFPSLKSFLSGKSLDFFSTFCLLLLPMYLILFHHSPLPPSASPGSAPPDLNVPHSPLAVPVTYELSAAVDTRPLKHLSNSQESS